MRSNTKQVINAEQGGNSEQAGIVLPYVLLFMIVLFGFAAFAVDVSQALAKQRQLQYSTDAAALSAVAELAYPMRSDDLVAQAAAAAVSVNGIANPVDFSARCGEWAWNPMEEKFTFASCVSGCQTSSECDLAPCADCADNIANAVQVGSGAAVGSVFAGIYGISELTPTTQSVALIESGGLANCIKPFAIENSAITDFTEGAQFTVGWNSPGNWGKIDLGYNMSSGPVFEELMVNGICDMAFAIGQEISAGTGSAGVRDAFNELIELGLDQNLLIASVSDFGNGNSVEVVIQNFCEVNLVTHNDHGGNNWNATFELIRCDVDPPNGGVGLEPVRVLVQ